MGGLRIGGRFLAPRFTSDSAGLSLRYNEFLVFPSRSGFGLKPVGGVSLVIRILG